MLDDADLAPGLQHLERDRAIEPAPGEDLLYRFPDHVAGLDAVVQTMISWSIEGRQIQGVPGNH